MAFLNKGLSITLTDERPEATEAERDAEGMDDELPPRPTRRRVGAGQARTVAYRYDDGLVDYVKHLERLARGPRRSTRDVIAFETEDTERQMSLEMAMQWTTAYSESVHTYANTINTHEGGTHEEGFRAAMTSLINRYAREKKLLKEKDENLTGDDIREGLTAVISVKLGEPQFEGQTKTKLGNSEVKGFVQRVVTDELGDWLGAQPERGPRRHPQVDPGRGRPDGGPQGPRGDPPQGPAGVRRHARQAARLPVQRPGQVRGLHRRG